MAKRKRETVAESQATWPESIPIPDRVPDEVESDRITAGLGAAITSLENGEDFAAISKGIAEALGTFAKAAL